MGKDVCPEGMQPIVWQRRLRAQMAQKSGFAVAELKGHWSPGAFSVGNPKSRKQYTVIYHGRSNPYNSCQCMDFRTNNLGTCKHLEAVAQWCEAKNRRMPAEPTRPVLDVCYRNGRRLRLRIAGRSRKELAMAAMRYFDDDSLAVRGMIQELPAFIEQARKIDPSFHCTTDALNLILEERDRLRRQEIGKSLTDKEISSVLKTTLYPYQIEGIRFGFNAGRVLFADEMGLGKTVQALGMAELLRQRNMIGSVLVVCPTSLKYQWKKEIERFTAASVTVVEGIHTRRRELYADEAPYKIVSYHTLANDIKSLGSLVTDMLIMDEVQRLKNWNTQISQAARRIDSDYAAVISGTPLENKIEELYSVMQFVDQYALGPLYEFMERTVVHSETGKVTGYRNLNETGVKLKPYMIRRRKADVALQLPERSDKVLFVPMTKEQKEIHDEANNVVAQLVAKWQRHRFLSEKDRKRLLLLLSQMRMVCDSTYILDLKTHFDTKVTETVQLILALIENGDDKAVVFSQWERMTSLICAELEKAGIAFENLHGGIPADKRGAMCERFNTQPEVRVFVSTDAGSTGLNLQTASTIINLDLPWNPAVLEQRIGRIHRIGQQRNIQVINLVAAGTIEERMLATLNFKSNLFAGILDQGDDSITLDDEKLTRVAEGLSRMMDVDEEKTDMGTLIGSTDTETPVKTSESDAEPIDATPETPEPSELVRSGLSFLQGLARTLRSEESTRRLVDELVHTDPSTGQQSLQIPIPDKESIVDILMMLNKFVR